MLGDSWQVGIDILEGFEIKLCKTKEKWKKNLKRARLDEDVNFE